MLDTMTDEDRILKVLTQVLPYLGSRRRITEPTPPDAMDPGIALINRHLRVHERVQNNAALLINQRHFAEDVFEIGNIHFAVNCDKQRKPKKSKSIFSQICSHNY